MQHEARLRNWAILGALALTGCMTAQVYEGERRPRSEVALISGDVAAISANAPISAVLRQVDGITLRAGQSSVEVLPGTHTLLVDCRIAETGAVTRHSIEVEVFEGRAYRLVADAGPGLQGCADVRLEASGDWR
jgi:hypothetical protein